MSDGMRPKPALAEGHGMARRACTTTMAPASTVGLVNETPQRAERAYVPRGMTDSCGTSSASGSLEAGVGERCRKLKFFLWFHQDPSMSSSKQRVKGESLHLHTTCRSRAEACKVMM